MLQISFNDHGVQRALNSLPKQTRFATAVALTRTAKDAQGKVRQELPERFTIRNGWVAKGIRIRPASKSHLESAVTILDKFMALQETGGTKRSHSGKGVAIPVGARPTPRSITRPSKFPGALLRKPRHFIAPFARNPAQKAVWRKVGRGGGKRKLMYMFADEVEIQPRFGFQETVEDVAQSRFDDHFFPALEMALRTSK